MPGLLESETRKQARAEEEFLICDIKSVPAAQTQSIMVMGSIRRDCMNWSNTYLQMKASAVMPPELLTEQSLCRMQNIS